LNNLLLFLLVLMGHFLTLIDMNGKAQLECKARIIRGHVL